MHRATGNSAKGESAMTSRLGLQYNHPTEMTFSLASVFVLRTSLYRADNQKRAEIKVRVAKRDKRGNPISVRCYKKQIMF